MAKTPRPDVEWVFDDNGKMELAAVYDFTSAEFDSTTIGVVFGFTTGPDQPAHGEQRFQWTIEPDMALALAEALVGHAERAALARKSRS